MNVCLGIFTASLLFIAARGVDGQTVVLKPDLASIYTGLGQTISVECTAQGKAGHNTPLVWETPAGYKEGVSTYPGMTETRDGSETTTVSITVSNITKENLGVYKCVFGSIDGRFNLVNPVENLTIANYTYGDTSATLGCDLIGPLASKTVIKREWLKNKTLISELTDKERFTEHLENQTLTISKPTRDDADLYALRFTFDDKDPPFDCQVPYNAEPLVLDFDKSKNLIEGDKLELQCKVKGFPRPIVQWLKNNQVLNMTEGNRIQLGSLNGFPNAHLIIKAVEFEDAGDYTCRATSSYFNMSIAKTLVVRVKDKLAALWPFLGIVGEVVILCAIIFIYERRRNKQAERDVNNVQDVDGSATDKKEGLRHRNTQGNNPTA